MSKDESMNFSDFDQDSTAERILIGLSKVSLALKSQSWQDAGQYGLSPTQAQILSLLQAKGSEGMRLSAVAKGLAVTPATASDAVRVLSEKGLVQKIRSPQDGRAIAITLTPKGKSTAAETSCWSDLFLDAVGQLSELEQTVFLRGLIKMILKLQEGGQIPISKMCVTCRFFQANRYPNSDRPHHCDFVDAPFGDRNLHLECPEQIAI
ncbi:Transcriptional regulator [Planktothrix paucivesiculata PCC 9631]|uniref:Transcriptional regulator n=2 Tax=Planktothrix TaxID=54304 RepID=A0A7Z9E4W4_9CYAN|nr:Transcriptional regulator [Planktothrix paucivesiculata PCC 9631]